MASLPILTHSQRAALLAGVSLIALQGMSACADKRPHGATTYEPPVAGGGVSQGYRPVGGGGTVTTLAIGEEG